MKNILINEQQREIDWLKSEYVKGDDYYVWMNLQEKEEWLKVQHIERG